MVNRNRPCSLVTHSLSRKIDAELTKHHGKYSPTLETEQSVAAKVEYDDRLRLE